MIPIHNVACTLFDFGFDFTEPGTRKLKNRQRFLKKLKSKEKWYVKRYSFPLKLYSEQSVILGSIINCDLYRPQWIVILQFKFSPWCAN